LLPLGRSEQVDLLALDDPELRLDKLSELVDRLSGEL